MDWTALRRTVATAVRFLDRAIDLSFYPTPEAAAANRRWRPIGLGVMGLADVFFRLRLDFDSDEARELSTLIAEQVALAAYETSADLAERHGRHPAYGETRTADGVLHLDHWPEASPALPERWAALGARNPPAGLRNSRRVAMAPTPSIASIAGSAGGAVPTVAN